MTGRRVGGASVQRPRRSGAVLLALLALACGGGDDAPAEDAVVPPVAFDTARVRLVSGGDTVPLRVELAATDEQRAFGLMLRPSLPADAGMLFLYEDTQPADAGFWMFRTRIPLDIAFLDSTGTIRAIHAMAPCDSTYARSCPTYPAGVPYRAALEVNQGFFERRGIEVGDRVLLEDLGPTSAPRPPGTASSSPTTPPASPIAMSSDAVLRRAPRAGAVLHDRASVGGRFAPDGASHGTRRHRLAREDAAGAETALETTSAAASASDAPALAALLSEMTRRAPRRGTPDERIAATARHGGARR